MDLGLEHPLLGAGLAGFPALDGARLGGWRLDARMGADAVLRVPLASTGMLAIDLDRPGRAYAGLQLAAFSPAGAAFSAPVTALAEGVGALQATEVRVRARGAVSVDGRVMGCYLHGLFAADGFRRAFLTWLGARSAGTHAHEAAVERQGWLWLRLVVVAALSLMVPGWARRCLRRRRRTG